MNKSPFLTIITVCLNSAKTIRHTFESVLAQNFSDFEYIVIDGGSTDGTIDIIKEYEEKFNIRGIDFQWSSGSDHGIYDAMNKGIALATGELVGIINSDDYYEKNAFVNLENTFKSEKNGDVYYGFMRVLFDGKELVTYRYNFDTFLLNPETGVYTSAQHSSCFAKKAVYESIGMFDTQFKIAADYDFLIRVAKNKLKFVAIDAILANFSRGGANDQMTDYDRFSQRYKIWYKNGLISEKKYKKLMKQTKYSFLKAVKTRIVKIIFSYK
jgi:glycosyltransferase involved in cell wall biosynthesis